MELPVEIIPLENARSAVIRLNFPNYRGNLFRSEHGGLLMGEQYWNQAKEIYNMEVRPDDTWVVTFPKCGTTWTQDMTWLIANDCNFEGAKVPLSTRFPFLEFTLLPGITDPEHQALSLGNPVVEDIEKMDSPRYIKTHLPFHVLPPNLLDSAKVVYVARNPKDVITSYYHHHKLVKLQYYTGSLDEFVDHFVQGETLYGSFLNHVTEAWDKRFHPNLHFVFYEDMKKDLRGEIEKLASFLGKNLTEEQKDTLIDHLNIKNFRNNPAVNFDFGKKVGVLNMEGSFIRKGETGDWKNHFTESMRSKVDKWVEANLQNTTLTFKQ